MHVYKQLAYLPYGTILNLYLILLILKYSQ